MSKKKKPTKQKPNGKAKAKEESRDRVEKFETTLRVILNDDQVKEIADRAAHLIGEHDDKQDNFKAQQKQAKAELEAIEAKIRELSGYVRDKAKYVEVECERRYDYARCMVVETRLDTKEVIRERPMTAEERQLGLDLEEDKKKKDGEEPNIDEEFNDDEGGEGAPEKEPEDEGGGEEAAE